MDSRTPLRHREITRRAFLQRIVAWGITTASLGVLTASTGCVNSATVQTVAPTEPPPAMDTPVSTAVAQPAPTSAPATAAPMSAAPTEVPEATQPAEPTQPVTAQVAPTATPVPRGAAYLAVARGASPAAITRAALDAIGGIERFCQPGYDVIVKPNICNAYHSFEYASTTNPEVVATLVTLCLDAGAKRVRVVDYPFGGTAEAAYEKSGIRAAVEAAGGEMEVIAALKYKEVDLPLGQDLKRCVVYRDALEADLLINVPIAKHHTMAGLTLGMKNLMGLIRDRPSIHHNFRQRLPDLASLFQPALTVVDAVRILTAHGPTGGSLDDVVLTNTVIASHDIVAADACATSLFDQTPDQISYIVGGAEMGLGTLDLASVDVQEIDI